MKSMDSDLFIYLGLSLLLLAVCFIVGLKIKGLFRGFRKLKTESDIRRLRTKSLLVRRLFSSYKWWQGRKNPDHFMNACRSGDLERVKVLIKEGIDVDMRLHKGGRTGLALAVQKNQPQVVEFLLACGADESIVGGAGGKTALIRAAELGNIQITKMLVDHSANLDIRSKISGKTALMKAAEAGFFEIAKYLVEKGADVHFRDREGRTALSLALGPVNQNALGLLEMLIEAGANVNVIDNEGLSPLDRAREFGLTDCEELLKGHGAISGRRSQDLGHGKLDDQHKRAYEILGCKPGDTDDQIRKLFHEMAKKYHPDSISGKDLPEDFVIFANQRFVELHESYRVVMEERKRSSAGRR